MNYTNSTYAKNLKHFIPSIFKNPESLQMILKCVKDIRVEYEYTRNVIEYIIDNNIKNCDILQTMINYFSYIDFSIYDNDLLKSACYKDRDDIVRILFYNNGVLYTLLKNTTRKNNFIMKKSRNFKIYPYRITLKYKSIDKEYKTCIQKFYLLKNSSLVNDIVYYIITNYFIN